MTEHEVNALVAKADDLSDRIDHSDFMDDVKESHWLSRLALLFCVVMLILGVVFIVIINNANRRAEQQTEIANNLSQSVADLVGDVQALRTQIEATGQVPIVPEPSPEVIASAGDPGPQGEKGEKGDTGEAGRPPTADEILAAVRSYCSSNNCDGPTGSPGAPGMQGLEGPEGARGPQGPQGATGPAGQPGPAGPQGDPGPAGPAGPQGPPAQTMVCVPTNPNDLSQSWNCVVTS